MLLQYMETKDDPSVDLGTANETTLVQLEKDDREIPKEIETKLLNQPETSEIPKMSQDQVEINNGSDPEDDPKQTGSPKSKPAKTDCERKYKKLKKKYRAVSEKLSSLNEVQDHYAWYPSYFLEKFTPIMKGTLEYEYALHLAKPHFHHYPKLILKQNTDENQLEYSYFINGTLPFKIKVELENIIQEINQKPQEDSNYILYLE